jgi:protein phosphatase-4 regulatory subunit 3
MRDIAVQRKVHHTYRLQFLKDVVLARALDDSTFNVLSSCIIFNQIDIISHLQQDQTFLFDIVKLFINDDGDAKKADSQERPQMLSQEPTELLITDSNSGDESKPEVTAMDVDQQQTGSVIPKLTNGASVVNGNVRLSRAPPGSFLFCPPDGLTEEGMNLRREVIMLLQQLSVMGKNVQMPARLALFRTLVDRGILLAVQWALSLPERDDTNKQMISAAGEVLSAMLDHDLNGVRGHVLKQVFAVGKVRGAGKKSIGKTETILDMACRIMAQSKDLSVQSQMGDALRSWLEVPSGDLPAGPAGSEVSLGDFVTLLI